MVLVNDAVEGIGLGPRMPDGAAKRGITERFVRAKVDATRAGRDCPERILGLKRMPDLAHRDGIERKVETTRDLGCNDDAAAGKSHDDRVTEIHALERHREAVARIGTIAEVRTHQDGSSAVAKPSASGKSVSLLPELLIA